MAYKIDNCTGTPGEIRELSAFLADFTAGGEMNRPQEIDMRPETWESRLHGWWADNPYAREDSPRGLVLRDDTGDVVGFFGLVPHDYVLEGRRIPSVILTTSYVRKANRDAALGLFLRAHREFRDYQFVDGSPNPGARALLMKTGYRQGAASKMLLYPVRRASFRPQSWALQVSRLGLPGLNGHLRTGRLVTDLDSVTAVAAAPDAQVRKHIDRETLAWYLKAGSQRKFFAGWCDDRGVLQCYVIGIPWRKLGQNAFVIIDYAALGEGADGILDELVIYLARHPEKSGLPAEVDLVIWPIAEETRKRRSPYAAKLESQFFYRLPPQLGEARRLSCPFEGDKLFY